MSKFQFLNSASLWRWPRFSLARAISALAVLAVTGGAVVVPAVAADPDPIKPIEVKPALADLGKRLFFDPRLSGDANSSCASCHQPDKAFTDGKALSDAYTGSKHFRNTPTLANVGHRAAWMHDGRLGTNLNDVTREMLTETYLMNMDMRIMQERLKQDPVYVKMFKSAGLGEPSNGGVRKAIENFVKTIASRDSAFDAGLMSASAKRGYALFNSKAGCAQCHSGNRFTDDKPHNIGVPNNPEIWSDHERHVTFVTYAKFFGLPNYMNLREDLGAFLRTHRSEHKRSFLTPTLRELTYTAPYMHNGMFKSLEEVVDFYNAGGGDDANKDARIKPLGLIPSEKKDLIEFLKALSGEGFDRPEYTLKEEIDTDYPLIANWRDMKN